MNDAAQEIPASYREAIAELDKILAELEGDGVQVDEMAQRVERAAWLITHCQSVLSRTRNQVKGTLDSLESGRLNPGQTEAASQRS